MPLSKRQLRWANTPSGHAALGDARVAEWDRESKGITYLTPVTTGMEKKRWKEYVQSSP